MSAPTKTSAKDIVAKLTKVAKLDESEGENVAEVQRINKRSVKRLKIIMIIVCMLCLASIAAAFIIGYSIRSTTLKTSIIDAEDARFKIEVKELGTHVKDTNSTITDYKAGLIFGQILNDSITAVSNIAILVDTQKEADIAWQNATRYKQDLLSVDWASYPNGFRTFIGEHHATFVGFGCHSDKDCGFSGANSNVATFSHCTSSCSQTANMIGFTYEIANKVCYCNEQKQQTFHGKLGYVYYRFA